MTCRRRPSNAAGCWCGPLRPSSAQAPKRPLSIRAKKSLAARAKDRPDLVKQVIDLVRTEGIARTYTAVKAKLDGTTALGYSAAGIIAAVGEG